MYFISLYYVVCSCIYQGPTRRRAAAGVWGKTSVTNVTFYNTVSLPSYHCVIMSARFNFGHILHSQYFLYIIFLYILPTVDSDVL